MSSLASRFKSTPRNVIFWLCVVFFFAAAALLYSQWNDIVAAMVGWQKTLHAMLAEHIRSVSQDAVKYGGALVALSFAYGAFHAVGPGHGKAVIVTYLGTNRESVWRGIVISLCAAMLQSIVAIVLVSALARLLKFKLADVHNYGNDIALVSYVLVMLLGVMLVATSVRRLLKARRAKMKKSAPESLNFKPISPVQGLGKVTPVASPSPVMLHADHGPDCGCSHTHVPEENESLWQTLGVIVSMGLRPCSGAIVVLIYAHLVDVYFYGVLATFMMGVGTGLSVSAIAVATLYARAWLSRVVANPGAHASHMMSHYVRLAGGVVLVALGWSFYRAASLLAAGHPLF